MRIKGEFISSRLGRWMMVSGIVISLGEVLLFANYEGVAGKTLKSLIDDSTQAITAGDYALASEIFALLEREFSEDDEYNEARLQNIIMPTRGYAQLVSGQPEEAIETLKGYLQIKTADERKRSFAVFTLGRSYEDANKWEEAMDTYHRFEKMQPGKMEVALSIMRRAEILFKYDNKKKSIELLNDLFLSDASYTLRIQARLRALQKSLEINNIEMAELILFNTEWALTSMLELAVLAFCALQVGDSLLTANNYQNAIRCYRMIPQKDILITAQKKRLQQIRATYEDRAPLIAQSSARIWLDYYQQLIQKIELQLKQLEESEDYTPGFLLRYGQSLLLAGRSREALIVFESLSTDKEFNEDTRITAHYRWIVAAGALENWDEALN